MPVSSTTCEFGARAPDFLLADTSGRLFRYADIAGPRGSLVMFICNHCPYVQSIVDRIQRDAAALQKIGIGVVAISSNDVETYPQDGPEKMRILAEHHGFTFPYLYDPTQEVARAYDAQCTPDFFGYNARSELQYRGRLDSSGKKPAEPDVRRELFEAMALIAQTGQGPREQVPSMGCSIKWRSE
ncbi:thioredoxin family protein [Paracoccus sp. MBLB3053]|uniref:Thioredoxin family protein n=1 Tax=Paracoccus aurantius TaxID=3073814 RepID=A0ABU2HVE8_9RHOB|nr:thioredoxin family protein [Paracoccus sp. MBLB3053]MDS9468259.1 thioredoxin family protein [Paracoccus sp. MBLB3053]